MKDEAFISKQFRKKCSREVDQHCPDRKTKYIFGKKQTNKIQMIFYSYKMNYLLFVKFVELRLFNVLPIECYEMY